MKQDLTGHKFNRMLVVERYGVSPVGKAIWKCVCDCGNERLVGTNELKSGHTKSCGCYQRERAAAANLTHGGTAGGRSREFGIWINIRERCLNPENPAYPNYGGRGIGILEAWRDDFGAFRRHIGDSPTSKHTLDRIDNDRGYEPGNIRWATHGQQNRNKRRNRFVMRDGQRMLFVEACEAEGLNYYNAYSRMKGPNPPFEWAE